MAILPQANFKTNMSNLQDADMYKYVSEESNWPYLTIGTGWATLTADTEPKILLAPMGFYAFSGQIISTGQSPSVDPVISLPAGMSVHFTTVVLTAYFSNGFYPVRAIFYPTQGATPSKMTIFTPASANIPTGSIITLDGLILRPGH